MAFIIIYIFSFIICISCATHTALLSSLDGQLVSSCRSRLLAALLSSWSSLSCWSLVGRWLLLLSSFSRLLCWSLGCCSSLWFNCCSNSWLHWVSRLTTVARVYTCLSAELEGFLGLLVNGSHWSHLDHATLCFRSNDMANHSFPTNDTNWWCTKSSTSWSSTRAPIRVPKKQKNKEPTGSTGRVLAKGPLKVKSEWLENL